MYKGDIYPKETYQRLSNEPRAVLIDVRCQAEWGFVGVPAIDGLLRIAWQNFPGMEKNDDFVGEVEAANIEKDQPIFLICRSGQRSASAASALTEAGFTDCYNVAEGFEGDKDTHGHRGTLGGWKQAGLPWVQS